MADRLYNEKPPSLEPKEFRSALSAKPDDMIFTCEECGRPRIFGKKVEGGPDDRSPLLNCHNVRVHKKVKLTRHQYAPEWRPEL